MTTKVLYKLPALLALTCVLMTGCRLNLRDRGSPPVPEETAAATIQSPTAAPTEGSVAEAFQFQTGRNDYVINVDDGPREFPVYVFGQLRYNQARSLRSKPDGNLNYN